MQKQISSFFKPVGAAACKKNEKTDGPGKVTEVFVAEGKENKKNDVALSRKRSSPEDSKHSADLSPEALRRIKAKKDEALQRKLLKSKDEVQNSSADSIGHTLRESLGESWSHVLLPEFEKDYFKKLLEYLESERSSGKTIYPAMDRVFEWTRMCAFEDVKVVILGQDPYHGPGQAHGLCFSVQPGVRIPPSLVNMYKELESDVPGFKAPGHGYLVGWAHQGVLLLNACLTVRKGEANAHKDRGWEKFTDSVIQAINDQQSGVVFILWGGYAAKKGARINKKKHQVLQGPHPSPLSAHRGFFGCKHFSKANDYLVQSSKPPINWQDVGDAA